MIHLFTREAKKILCNPWVNYRGFESLGIETQLHATSLVFCFMCFLNKVLSLAVSQPKNSVCSCIFTSWCNHRTILIFVCRIWVKKYNTSSFSISYYLLYELIMKIKIYQQNLCMCFNGGWAVLGTLDWLIHFKKIGGNLHVFPERPKMI